MDKFFAHVTKYLHAHASGFGAALVLLINKLQENAPLDRGTWGAIAAAYIGVGTVVSTLPHGGAGVAPDHDAAGTAAPFIEIDGLTGDDGEH